MTTTMGFSCKELEFGKFTKVNPALVIVCNGVREQMSITILHIDEHPSFLKVIATIKQTK